MAGADEILVLSHDVGVEEECQALVEKTAQHFGGLISSFLRLS